MEIFLSPCYAFSIQKGEYRITMKKNLFMLPFAIALLTSCGSSSNSNANSPSSTSTPVSESTPGTTSTEPEIVVSTLDEMCAYLEEKGVVYGENKIRFHDRSNRWNRI